jgi:hypothetical protein
VSTHAFLIVFAAGAAALALWVDRRFPGLSPESIRASFLHVGVSIAVGQLLVPLAIKAAAGTGSPELVLVVVFGVALPALVYGFLAAFWVMKLLAGQLRGSPR